jgi:glycosyltransferase involved in cell wall biosynthesis
LKIVVISAIFAGSRKANAINTTKMAQAFRRLGHDVTFICRSPADGFAEPDQLETLYGIDTKFDWIQLTDAGWEWLPQTTIKNLFLMHWVFGWKAKMVLHTLRPDLVFCRNYVVVWLAARMGINTLGESHAHPGVKRPAFQLFLWATRLKKFRLLVTISDRLRENFIKRGVPEQKLIVLEDAVDLTLFAQPQTLPPSPYAQDRFSGYQYHVVYTGHLYDYKGIPIILQSAQLLPHIYFHLVGGFQEDIDRHQRTIDEQKIKNICLHRFIPQSELPPYLWHANILLLPPSLNHPSAAWTSPVKLYEYLASGTPVVASRIPALTDWLTEQEVEFVTPDDASAMAKGITHLINNKERSDTLSKNGLQRASKKTYIKRVKKILDLVSQTS